MLRHNIPTAKYMEFDDVNSALENIDMYGYPLVIKADGLASGKGVIIAENEEDARDNIIQIMKENRFGLSGNKIIIEEFLTGVETSILTFVDERCIVPMVSAKDHKKIFDGETGENTGGMGAFSPSNIYDEELEEKINEDILKPILKGLNKDGLKFKGVLFIGLMITNDGIKVLEFNVRFGDPETQVILNKLKTPLVDICSSVISNKLSTVDISFDTKHCVCVVLSSKGYPNEYEIGKEIIIGDIDDGVTLLHSGTCIENGKLLTNAGRVLGVLASADDLKSASELAYKNVNKIHFEGMHYRRDIGTV